MEKYLRNPTNETRKLGYGSVETTAQDLCICISKDTTAN